MKEGAVEVWERGIYRAPGGGCTASVRAVVTGGRLGGGCGRVALAPRPRGSRAAGALAEKRA
jgi:hypothetical protein